MRFFFCHRILRYREQRILNSMFMFNAHFHLRVFAQQKSKLNKTATCMCVGYAKLCYIQSSTPSLVFQGNMDVEWEKYLEQTKDFSISRNDYITML